MIWRQWKRPRTRRKKLMGRGLDRTGTVARFVRLYTRQSADGARPRYVELAVYGKKAEKDK